MASNKYTTHPHRSRRNPPQTAAAAELPPPEIPPRTLEEAIENVRTLTLQLRAVLHCLSDVLLCADDEDSMMHAEVARSASEWASFAAAELDLTKLTPLIDAVRRRGGSPGEGGPEPAAGQIYQVREPMAVYQV